VRRASGRIRRAWRGSRRRRLCLIDFLACAFEAADLPWSRQAEAVATALPGGASIVGSGKTTPAGDAAFADAVRGHGLVREDMHSGSIAHLGVVVWPALFGSVVAPCVAIVVAAPFMYAFGWLIHRGLIRRVTGVQGASMEAVPASSSAASAA
jgi:hypothetical protein